MLRLSLILFLLSSGFAGAHHSPDELIAELTLKIEAAGDSDPLLFYKRATEYRALRQYAEAAADFRRVADLCQNDPSPRKALAQVLLWQNEIDEARDAVNDALTLAQGDEKAATYVVLAEVERTAKKNKAALVALDEAFEIRPIGEIDWYLLRSELQDELKQTEKQIADLKTGYEATASIVLRNEWIEALLDGGYYQMALPVIETELAACRLKSSWLIRRAKALTGLQQDQAAKADLLEALEELDRRVHPLRPHPGLLLDRAFVHISLSNKTAAREDFAKAQKIDPVSWRLRRLLRQFPELSGEVK